MSGFLVKDKIETGLPKEEVVRRVKKAALKAGWDCRVGKHKDESITITLSRKEGGK